MGSSYKLIYFVMLSEIERKKKDQKDQGFKMSHEIGEGCICYGKRKARGIESNITNRRGELARDAHSIAVAEFSGTGRANEDVALDRT